jgi:general stress protein 26
MRSVPFRWRRRAAIADSLGRDDWPSAIGVAPAGRNSERRGARWEEWQLSDSSADVDRVWTLIKDIPVAMVVTHNGQGQDMRARPMAVRPAQDEGAIYFLTDVDAPKSGEIRRNDTICLALADHKSRKYLSISGHGEIIDDPDRVKQIWSIYDKAFWPDENDRRIRILRVTPESAEFWEGAGAVVTAVKLVAASLSGERVNLCANEKVGFRP